MSVKVTWSPSPEPDIAGYELQRADNLSGAPWTVIATIDHSVVGGYYENGKFFFNDPTGDNTKFYRLIAVDLAGNRSAPSTAFQAAGAEPSIPNGVRLDHNYGGPGLLSYKQLNGVPIENALIRIWKKIDFDTGNTSAPLAITRTNARGEWASPVFLSAGYTYTVQFHKEGSHGPDVTEVIV